MPRLEDLESWIEVDGERLPEFLTQIDEDEKKVSCWIPSETGKNFAIHWQDHMTSRTTASFIKLDGISSQGSFLEPGYSHAFRIGKQVTNGTQELFQFCPVALTEDESAVPGESTLKELGTILVEVKEGAIGDSTEFTPPAAPSHAPIYEKLKKAGCHRIQSGGVVPSKANAFKFFWNGVKSWKFLFQYQSRDILEANKVMPKESPATAQTSEEDNTVKAEDSETASAESETESMDDEYEKLQAKKKAIQTQLEALEEAKKRKATGEKGKPAKRRKTVKKEEIRPTIPFKTGEIIDLT